MKIAFVGGFAFRPKGTISARAYPLAVELVRRGHEVTVFLTPYDNLNDSGLEWSQEGVRIRNLKASSTPLGYPGLLIRLLRALDQYRPDLVHIFKPKGFAGAAGSYLLLKGVRTVALDCDDWEGWGGWNDVKHYPWLMKQYIDRQERWMMRSAPVVTVASRALHDRVVEVRGNKSGVYYVPNCGASNGNIAVQEFARARSQTEARSALGLPEGLLIFYSGHFEPGEDAIFFCRAAAPAAERNNASIVIVGDGPDLPRVRDFFSNRPGVKVRFFPKLPYEQFVLAIHASDIAAFPYPDNQVHRSKCSARIIDYMAMGKPVITSALGQNREYLVDGESGILTPPDDENAFAAKLELLLQDPDLRERIGRNAERRIRGICWSSEPLQQCLAAYEKISCWPDKNATVLNN